MMAFGWRLEGSERQLMPSQLQWLRARAIHRFFESSDNVDCSIHQLVFKFCDCPPQIFSGKDGHAFALLTDWGSVATWGCAESGGDSSGVAAQLVQDGRIELVDNGWSQHDMGCTTVDSMISNWMEGHLWINKTFGSKVTCLLPL